MLLARRIKNECRNLVIVGVITNINFNHDILIYRKHTPVSLHICELYFYNWVSTFFFERL